MTDDPAISVVLPTYNHLRYLPAAIADIVGQTRADWELIVVDDGSTDGTADWLSGSALDPRIRWLRQDNAGPDQAINTGIRAARGDYVTWVSADNRCAPYFLEALAAALDCEPAAQLAYSSYYAIDANDRVAAMKFDNLLLLRELVTGTPRGMAGFMYRRALHDQVGWYEGLTCDTRMWARIVEAFPTVFVLEPTCYYRFHDDRASVREQPRLDRERPAVLADFLARAGGAGAASLLRRLYPGLATLPTEFAAAGADAAVRLAQAGAVDAAQLCAGEALRHAEPGGLWTPIAAAVMATLRAGGDPLDAVLPALAENPRLDDAVRDAALLVATALAELAAVGGVASGSSRMGRLDPTHPLCLAERPRVFSYAAWKLGHRATPLPAF
jgi:hypothetical protein